jgi:hypothetical protein
MKFALAVISLALTVAVDLRAETVQCLPESVKPTDVVSTTLVQTDGGTLVEKITVEQKLTELKANCKNGRLVDGAGTEIYFYKLRGCWGNPPRNYQEILERQEAELAILRKQYMVIEMTCNPSGFPIR